VARTLCRTTGQPSSKPSARNVFEPVLGSIVLEEVTIKFCSPAANILTFSQPISPYQFSPPGDQSHSGSMSAQYISDCHSDGSSSFSVMPPGPPRDSPEGLFQEEEFQPSYLPSPNHVSILFGVHGPTPFSMYTSLLLKAYSIIQVQPVFAIWTNGFGPPFKISNIVAGLMFCQDAQTIGTSIHSSTFKPLIAIDNRMSSVDDQRSTHLVPPPASSLSNVSLVE